MQSHSNKLAKYIKITLLFTVITYILVNIYIINIYPIHHKNEVKYLSTNAINQVVNEVIYKPTIDDFHSHICPMSLNLTESFEMIKYFVDSLNKRCTNKWFLQGGFMINLLRFGSLEVVYEGEYFTADGDMEWYYDKTCDQQVRNIMNEAAEIFKISDWPSDSIETRPFLWIGDDLLFENIEAYYYQIKSDKMMFNKYYGNVSVPTDIIFPLQTAYMHGLEFPVPYDPIQMMLTLPVPSDQDWDYNSSAEFWEQMKFNEYGSTCEKIVYYDAIAQDLEISMAVLQSFIHKCAEGLHHLGYASWHHVC
eukprot:196241_1